MNTDVNSITTDFDLLSRVGKLRVAVISDSAPERNGVGTYYVDLLRHLQSRLETSELFCPTIEEGKWQAGLVFPLPGDSTQKLCMPNPFTMQRYLNRVNPDVIIIATPGVYGLVGAFLAGRMKVPAIAGFHTSFKQLTDLYWHNSAAGKIVHGYFKVSNNYLFRKCQIVLANSEEMVQQARQLKPRKVQLIGTVISPVFTAPKLKKYQGCFTRILFAGRLAPEKNINAIISAARSIPEMEFSLAGDGPLREQVKKATKELPNLHFLGWLERDALREQIEKESA